MMERTELVFEPRRFGELICREDSSHFEQDLMVPLLCDLRLETVASWASGCRVSIVGVSSTSNMSGRICPVFFRVHLAPQ